MYKEHMYIQGVHKNFSVNSAQTHITQSYLHPHYDCKKDFSSLKS